MQLTTTGGMLAHIVVQKLWAGASIGYADVQELGKARVVLVDALEGEEGEYAVVHVLEVPRPVEELVVSTRVLDESDVLRRPVLDEGFFLLPGLVHGYLPHSSQGTKSAGDSISGRGSNHQRVLYMFIEHLCGRHDDVLSPFHSDVVAQVHIATSK